MNRIAIQGTRGRGRTSSRKGHLFWLLLAGVVLLLGARVQAAETTESAVPAKLVIRADKAGPVISKNIYGQFSEHLGHCIYEGIWVGEDSSIPNTRGIRNDVVTALKAMKVPVLRWPGGCFADE